MGLNDLWLSQVVEEPIEPDLRICDCHHHLWGKRDHPAAPRYLLDDFLADIDTGHRIASTVFVDSHAMYRADGPDRLRPIGEIEFANGVAAMSASGLYGPTRVAAAIVGHADMRLGRAVGEVLDAQIEAAPARFRGVRHATAFDDDAAVPNHRDAPVAHLMRDRAFRQGVAELGSRGLVYEAWCYHTQLEEFAALAAAVPETTIILNHCGGPLGIGPWKDRQQMTEAWRRGLKAAARCANVFVKLGGVNMPLNGHAWHTRPVPPSSDEIAEASAPYIEFTIETFGADRGMFESNYPAERVSCGYGVLWNAFKKITASYPHGEREALFHDNAVRIYRLES